MFTSYLLGAVLRGLPPVMNTNHRIELEPGQIFRGEIMKAFPNQMVQVQIGGAYIFAQLNAPLEVGQQAWLQVLPTSNPITLKVIDPPNRAFRQSYPEQPKMERQSVEQLLRSFGIKADRTNVQNLNFLIQNKIPLKVSEMPIMLEMMRQHPTTERIVQLFQFAQQRSIPITKESILSLESTLFGRPLEDVIQQLIQVKSNNPQLTKLIQQLNTNWQKVQSSMMELVRHDMVETNENDLKEVNRPIHSLPTSTATTQGALSKNIRLDGTYSTIEQQTNVIAGSENAQVVHATTTRDVPLKEHALLQFFKLIGLDYETQQLKPFLNSQVSPSSIPQEALRQIKGILLELNQLESLPANVKESVEHGIRSITGQQLLLLQDHQSPWHTTIIQIALPHILKHTEPSYIHIEGRKKHREGIDIENCRLFFHLELEALNTTMIDIQITSRNMNIVVYNDHSWLKEMIEESKDEWKRAVEPLSYQISSLRVMPTSEFASQKSSNPTYSLPSTYQGVDIRI